MFSIVHGKLYEYTGCDTGDEINPPFGPIIHFFLFCRFAMGGLISTSLLRNGKNIIITTDEKKKKK